MNITILNLPRATTKEELTKLFSTYGKIQSCSIIMDKITGLSKGFGFVEMASDDEGNAAIKDLHNKNFDGKRIRVKQAQSSNKSEAVS